jgi:hypothetical protein
MGVRFLFVLVVLGFSLNAWAAGDMILTLDDGREVILHEDNTWGFAKFTVSHGDVEDIYITVDDGRTVWLKMEDNTWSSPLKSAPEKIFSGTPYCNRYRILHKTGPGPGCSDSYSGCV